MCERKWYKISAEDKVLGRMATRIAVLLMGKDKPGYSPHDDKGDFVIVTDAGKARLTGNKSESKTYFKASRYPGNSKEITYKTMVEQNPERVIINAVKGMLPKNRRGARMLKRLKVYAGDKHPHSSQNPIDMEKN